MSHISIPPNNVMCADIEKPHSTRLMLARLRDMVTQSRRSYFSVAAEIITLRLGANKLSFEEYAALRLYDNTLYATTDKKAFIGFKALQKIWLKANYRFDLYGVVNNKILTDILFGTFGFPIMPTIAIYRDQVGRQSPFLLRSDEELRTFLTQPDHYPLFGKPMSGKQSVGTVSAEFYDVAHSRAVTTTRHGIPIATLMEYVKAHAASGYLFQKRVVPHAVIRALCGNRLATVRLLTIITNGNIKILRACWKIPAGSNVADNFWRAGNLLAQLDLESGQVLRVIRALETGFEEITHHPDTNTLMPGMLVPNWQEIKNLVTQAAKVIDDIALIGWDIAPVDSGALIVEINETPDFKLHQLADQRGVMDGDFAHFLTEREQHAKAWLRSSREKQKTITELVAPA